MLNLLKKLAVVLLVLFVAATAYYKVIVKKNVAVYRHHAVPALMYHSISEVPPGWPSEMCINPQLFEAQMKWLKDNGYKAVTVQEARAALMAGEDVSNLIMLTFDDGYKNNYTAAFPILKKYGFKGNFYVIGKDIGKSYKQDGVKEYMDKPRLKEMHEAGMEIGSHTMSHDPLAKIAPHYLPWEIYEPLNVFSRRNGGLHWFIHGIAFPNGSYNDAVLAEVKKYPKYEYGFSGRIGANTKETFEQTPFELRRIGVYDLGNGPADMVHVIRKSYTAGYLESVGVPVNTIQNLLDKWVEFEAKLPFHKK